VMLLTYLKKREKEQGKRSLICSTGWLGNWEGLLAVTIILRVAVGRAPYVSINKSGMAKRVADRLGIGYGGWG
jgi:hypothetical protein